MRGKRKSKSVNRTEHEPYASYPLPRHTTNLEEAVASDAAGWGSLRQAMKKDVLDYCPIEFDVILQVFDGEIRKTEGASRARTGCGSNQ